MSSTLTDCFLVKTNAHGERGTYAKYSYRPGELVYLVRGEVQRERTRKTIEVGEDQHVYDSYAEFINHSFAPNLELRGREMVAIAEWANSNDIPWIATLCTENNTIARRLYQSLGMKIVGQYHYRAKAFECREL